MPARSASTSVRQGNGVHCPVMALDKTPPEIGGSDSLSGQHRWLRITAGMVVVAVLAVGTWQVVEVHHEVSDLQTQNQSQQARLKNQQSQLDGLNSALGNTASGTSLSRIESQISALQGNTTNLAVRIGCVNLALNDATVSPDGSFFVSIRC